ncbi:hypothetical protein GCM10010485_09190 [Streptosporangium carneum]
MNSRVFGTHQPHSRVFPMKVSQPGRTHGGRAVARAVGETFTGDDVADAEPPTALEDPAVPAGAGRSGHDGQAGPGGR